MFNFYFKQDFSGFDRSAFLAVMTAFVIFSAVAAAIGIILYILRAIGIYKMSKTAGLEYPWLSFIPVASSYTLGRNAVLYTVLSVLFGFLEPVFIFVLRNKQPVYNSYEQ